MENKENNVITNKKRAIGSTVLYVIGVIVAIIGIALLVTDVLYYKSLISQYVAQGYAAATVEKQLIPSQLLPAVFNAVGLYGGLAALLFGAGVINTKVTASKAVEVTEAIEEKATEETAEV